MEQYRTEEEQVEALRKWWDENGRSTVIAVIIALAPNASLGSKEIHKDTELGFQIKVPRSWKKIPIATSEKWVVAKYLSNRELWGKKEAAAHTPFMKIILFPKEVVNDKGVKVKKDKNKVTISIKNPYKNFQEYLKANSYGGYYPTSEEEKTIRKVRTTCMEIRFEKLTVPRRALVWRSPGGRTCS